MDKSVFLYNADFIHIKASQIVRQEASSLERAKSYAEHDPELARLLRAGVEARVACSRALIAHLDSRREKK